MSAMNNAQTGDTPEGIAVIGMAGRFPGARSVAEFWRNLSEGVESIARFSDEELAASGVSPSVFRDPSYVNARPVLDDVELFDASFFGYTPREAEVMDPQQRLFLECAWEALENACCDPQRYDGLIGIYAGTSISTYLLSNLHSNPDIIRSVGSFQTLLGNDKDFMPARVAYKLNLRGPSVLVQTSCSTSLVAVHEACQSLLGYECDVALAGGVSVRLPQKAGYLYQQGGISSPDGHCRTFDARAQGTIGGNGVGVVVLKRLEDALADGDHISAVIKGSAINNDGSSKVGFTAPSVEGQAEVIMQAHLNACVEAETISYVEAHGTATPLGDPIEVAALTKAFRRTAAGKNFCALGSVKTNIGHLDAAAGVAGLIKTALSLEHRALPPSLHFEQPNPNIDFDESPFRVNAKLSAWEQPGGGHPLRAGVSSFGIGGTNSHVVLEEAPAVEDSGPSRPFQLLSLSAKTAMALDAATANLAAHLKGTHGLKLADVAYSLHVGRGEFGHRRTVVCRSVEEAARALEGREPKRVSTAAREAGDTAVYFMFPGQGAQHAGMARGLYESEPVFRKELDRCAALLEADLGLDLRSLLLAPEQEREETAGRLQQTALTQPALFAVEYALARLWMSWGVRPRGMIGHSVGEFVAACLAGVFSLEDALRLVAARGRLMQEMPEGRMLAVPLSEQEASSHLSGGLALAAVNGPALCVVSGPSVELEELRARLEQRGVTCRPLRTSHAFHSPMMEPAAEAFARVVKDIALAPPQLPYVSNVTGNWITEDEATDPAYWAAHLRQTVRFAQGLETLLAEPACVLLEVGPGQTLASLTRQHPERLPTQSIISSCRHADDGQHDDDALLTAAGRVWLEGVRFDWPAFYASERRRRLPLPAYPFERQRFWIEANRETPHAAVSALEPRRRMELSDWFYVPVWKQSPRPATRAESVAKAATWLIFKDGCGLGEKLSRRLRDEGHTVFTVEAGSGFERLGQHDFTIDARRAADYEELLRRLHESAKEPARIVHLWNVTQASDAPARPDSFEQSQALAFFSPLFLMQALSKREGARPLEISLVTNGVQSVTGDELLRPEKATLLGPCKVVAREQPDIFCRNVDVELPEPGGASEQRLLEQLLSEFDAGPSDVWTAYRGGRRWVQVFDRVQLDGGDGAGRTLPREGGVYLITGGLGGIGLVLAEHLARDSRAKLALVGRTPLPERAEWSRWLEEHDAEDALSRKIASLRALEQAGAEVLVFAADAADERQMREVFEATRARFGVINGVVHAAGVPGGGMLQLKSKEQAFAVLAPKVKGALVLEELLRGEPLDFFVLCSSITSLLPGFGQVDYCAANAFLDAFAYSQAARGGPFTVSINWGTWQEVGMAVNATQPANLRASHQINLSNGILSTEGVEALRRVLGAALPQVVVSPTDLQAQGDRYREHRTPDAGKAAAPQPVAAQAHARPNLGSAYVAPRNETEQTLADIWQNLLGIERVGVQDNFFELGGHSLLAIQLVSRVRDALLVELTMRSLFDSPTIDELAVLILQRQAEGADDETLARMLAELEDLSADESSATPSNNN
jgi:acyl transferase domain-containing protein/acyl carrier protein